MRTLYLYDETTKVFLESIVQPESPEENGVYFHVPNSTEKEPPTKIPNSIPIFNTASGSWELVADYRGQVWYDVKGGQVTIKNIGVPDSSLSQTLPQQLAFAELKRSKQIYFSTSCANQILAGFNSAAMGASYSYPGSTTDQMNVNLATISGGSLWCMDLTGVWRYINHTAAQAKIVQTDMINAIASARDKYANLANAVNAARNIADLELLVW